MKTIIQQCSNCGAPIKIGSSNCEFCGNPIIIYAENNPNNKNSQHDDFTIIKPIAGAVKALDYLFNNYSFGSAKDCDILGPGNTYFGVIQYGDFGRKGIITEHLGFHIATQEELRRFQNSCIYSLFTTDDNHNFSHTNWDLPHLSFEKFAHVITIFLSDICLIPQNLITFNIKDASIMTEITEIIYDHNGNTLTKSY